MKEKIARKIFNVQSAVLRKDQLSLPDFILWLFMIICGFIYYCLNYLKWFLYKKGALKRYRPELFSVSVGNIKIGGTGKSPIVIKMASDIIFRGIGCAVINRGYLGPVSGLNIVSDGIYLKKTIIECSDEAFMEAIALLGGKGCAYKKSVNSELMQRSQKIICFGENKIESDIGAVVLTSKHRVESMKYLESAGFEGIALLDDAFQYYRLEKALDIVVLDYNDPFSNGLTFPAGMLRDRLSRLCEADIVIVSKCPPRTGACDKKIAAIKKAVAKYGYNAELFLSGNVITEAYGVSDEKKRSFDSFSGLKVYVFSGLGNNHSFFSEMRKISEKFGFEIACEGFLDHENYSGETIVEIVRKARAYGASAIFTTFKDLVKQPAAGYKDMPLYAVSFETWISDEDRFYEHIYASYKKFMKGKKNKENE